MGAYWIQLRGLGECGIKRAQQLAILRYARGPYQPASPAPTYDVGIPQGVVSTNRTMNHRHLNKQTNVQNVKKFPRTCTRMPIRHSFFHNFLLNATFFRTLRFCDEKSHGNQSTLDLKPMHLSLTIFSSTVIIIPPRVQ